MKQKQCRFSINAIGKSGELYITSCDSKKEVKSWIDFNKDKIQENKIKITDNHKKNVNLKTVLFIAATIAVISYISFL